MASFATSRFSAQLLIGLLMAAVLAASAPLLRQKSGSGESAPGEFARASMAPAAPRQMIPAELVRVIDGDTVEIRALIWLDQHIVTRVRLRGIDAPELGGRCPDEARRAVEAAEALRKLLAGRQLHLTDIGRDKYGGRIIGRIMAGSGNDIGEAMLAAGHARPYAGGRRDPRCT